MANNFPPTWPPVQWPSDSTDYNLFDNPPFGQYYGDDSSGTTTNPYFDFNQNNMTDGQIYYDAAFNVSVASHFNPSNTPPTVDYLGPLQWLFYYVYYQIGQFVSFLNIPIPFIVVNNPGFFNSLPTFQNYGVMAHVFEPSLQDNGTVNFSVVDCNTGVEMYRFGNTVALSGVSKVVDGSLSTDPLSWYDYMILMNVLQIDLSDYFPLSNFLQTSESMATCLSTSSDPNGCNQLINNNLGQMYEYCSNFEWMWQECDLSKQKPRVLAVLNSTPNYLFGIPFLPWNSMKYQRYDNVNGALLPVSPYSLDNLTTVLKLVAAGYGIYFLKTKMSR